ncbi:hypothetical protein LCGC14_1099280 [marine sediment metagenome]|uniref:Uncharacterized protein n=1 Tax=marine sediment metagenome TaxID=412755 RepID=A0A0F9MA57_9ZZZZ
MAATREGEVMTDEEKLRMQYAGTLGLLCQMAVHATDEHRELIEQALIDAEPFGFRWRRILNRFEVEVK